MVLTVEPFKLFPIFMVYIYNVFVYLQQLWMGIWLHTHTITTTEDSADLGELAEILVGDISLQTMPLMVEAVDSFKLHLASMIYM